MIFGIDAVNLSNYLSRIASSWLVYSSSDCLGSDVASLSAHRPFCALKVRQNEWEYMWTPCKPRTLSQLHKHYCQTKTEVIQLPEEIARHLHHHHLSSDLVICSLALVKTLEKDCRTKARSAEHCHSAG